MVSSNYSNYTLFGIKNEAERQTWAASLIFILICSVLGDTAIFVASIKYNAFKLHETIVVFIQHIAVCDLLYSLAGIFPRIVSMISDGWVFGTTLSYIVAHSVYIANSAGLVLICAMTSSKLWLLKYPLRSQHVSRKKGHVVCVFIWFLSLAVPCSAVLTDKDIVVWDYRFYMTSYAFNTTKWRLLEITMLAFNSIPNLIVIATSILLIKHLLKTRKVSRCSRGKVRWQGLVTVVAVACIYTASIFPVVICQVAQRYVHDVDNVLVHRYLLRATTTFVYLNVASNFFVYFFTVQSFRSCIISKLQNIGSSLGQAVNNNGEYCVYTGISL